MLRYKFSLISSYMSHPILLCSRCWQRRHLVTYLRRLISVRNEMIGRKIRQKSKQIWLIIVARRVVKQCILTEYREAGTQCLMTLITLIYCGSELLQAGLSRLCAFTVWTAITLSVCASCVNVIRDTHTGWYNMTHIDSRIIRFCANIIRKIK